MQGLNGAGNELIKPVGQGSRCLLLAWPPLISAIVWLVPLTIQHGRERL